MWTVRGDFLWLLPRVDDAGDKVFEGDLCGDRDKWREGYKKEN